MSRQVPKVVDHDTTEKIFNRNVETKINRKDNKMIMTVKYPWGILIIIEWNPSKMRGT